MDLGRRDFFGVAASALVAGAAASTPKLYSANTTPPDLTAFQPAQIPNTPFVDMTGEEAIIAGYPLSWYQSRYELPLHIHHPASIRNTIRAFKEVFAKYYPKGLVRYALKANPHLEILKIVGEEKIGADVASDYEARAAIESKIDTSLIEVNGNAKSDKLLFLSLTQNMILVANDLEDFEYISSFAALKKLKARVMLRVSGFSMGNSKDATITTAGAWTKFGCSIKKIPQFITTLDKYPHIDFLGFHTHLGSQLTDVAPYLYVLGKLIELSELLIKKTGKCEIINIGGGYPINYVSEKEWDAMKSKILEGYLANEKGVSSNSWVWAGEAGGYYVTGSGAERKIKWSAREFACKQPKEKMVEAILKGEVVVNGTKLSTLEALKKIGEPHLAVEPGRSVVEESGVTLSKITQVRELFGKHFLTTIDAGITSFGGSFFKFPVNRWKIANNLSKRDVEPFNTFLAGNLCFSSDMPTRYKVELIRKPFRDDVLITFDTGAYSANFYSSNANSFPRPAQLMVYENGSIEVIKERDKYEDIV